MKAKKINNCQWHLIDAKGQILGRLATKIASLLRGKAKPEFVPYLNNGDNVVVINAVKIKVTGKKEEEKIYEHFSGYPGGRKVIKLSEMRQKNPGRIIRDAVKGMLPQNKLRDRWLTQLYVYADANHPYAEKFSAEGGSAPGGK